MDGSPWLSHLFLSDSTWGPLGSRQSITTAGNVVFSEIMLLPNGMSKGCG